MEDTETKTLIAGEQVEFDCSQCSRRFTLIYEPDYAESIMLTQPFSDVPKENAPDPATVEVCPFCEEPALSWLD